MLIVAIRGVAIIGGVGWLSYNSYCTIIAAGGIPNSLDRVPFVMFAPCIRFILFYGFPARLCILLIPILYYTINSIFFWYFVLVLIVLFVCFFPFLFVIFDFFF